MEFNRRYLLTLLAVVLAGVGFGYFLFGTGPDPSVSPDPSRSDGTDQSLSGFSLTENRTGDEVWRLFSPRANKEGDTVDLESPRVVLSVKGETHAVITAEQGTYRLSRRKLVLRGNVVLNRTLKNQVLETSVLKWDRESGKLETSARVRLRMPRGQLTATGMRAQLRKEIIRFLSDVEYSSR